VTRVLVVDDDVVVTDLIRLVLEDLEFEVSTAVSAEDLPGGPFDCVLTDLLTVRVYSPAGAQAWVLRLADRYPGVPIIVVTGHSSALGDAAAIGAYRVLMKPFDVEALTAAVREAITS
jgi:DNA-binding NtrC family response regulator